MITRVGSGSSVDHPTETAAREAIRSAIAKIGPARPRFGLLFAGPEHDLGCALQAAQETAGGADMVGCSTAGEFSEDGLTHGGVVVLLIASDDLMHQVAFGSGMKRDHPRVASDLCADFATLKRAAFTRQRLHSTTVLLTDGLSGMGEKTVEKIFDHTGVFQQIVGGAAGDEGRFEATVVGAGASTGTDAAAALHIFSSAEWGIGVGHGLRPSSETMLVTKAAGNVVYELDGRPAFEAYRRHAAGRGIELVPTRAGSYLICNELGIYFFGQLIRARAPLAVGEDGSLSCAADIPEGASVCILDGHRESMLAAARRAAEEAKATLQGAVPAGILLFDCVCRGMILKEDFQQEIDAVRSVFGDVPLAGFLTYGEIARYRGNMDGWHNTTAVVVAIPA